MNKAFPIILLALVAFGGGFYYMYSQKQSAPPKPVPSVVEEGTNIMTVEEKQMVQEAHKLGDVLVATQKRAEEITPHPVEQQKKLKPVYESIEDFMLRQLGDRQDAVASITVVFQPPGLQCTISLKPVSEEELEQIKRRADICVGRIVENQPMVKYLLVKYD